MGKSTAITVACIVALAITGCTSTSDPEGPVTDPDASRSTGATGADIEPGGSGDEPLAVQPVQLTAVGSCDALLDHYVDNAVELVTPWGLGHGGMVAMGDMATESMAAEDTAGGEADGGGQDDTAYSTTNVQEEGVDEPDTVKTDGELLITMTDNRLDVVDTTSAEVVGSLQLDEDMWNGELLLSGDDLLVLSTSGSGWMGPVASDDLVPAFPAQRTTVTRVDIADPADPTVVGTTTIEGSYRSARMVDGTVRLVIASQPTGLALTTPSDSGLAAEDDALAENKRLLRESELDDWVPHYRVTGPDGEVGEVQQLLPCDQVSRPATFSGFETLSVLTMAIDDDQMTPTSVAGLVASGETVYASTDRLIVATSPWGGWFQPFVTDTTELDDDITTQFHSFDITDSSATSYVGSGEVEGTIVNQFALSEVDGIVRVATTTDPGWWGRGGGEESQSSLVVLEERGGELVEIGRVDGLGVTEQIHSVRYLSPDVAAIVTFRQTDPLYLVDTSDPTAPEVAGELKIPGVSTYLHPIDDGWLLGVGQDATGQGRTTGLQLSLFDISDLSDPRRVDNLTWRGGYSEAEYDHHAFTYWPATGQVIMPMEVWDDVVEETGDGDVAPREDKPFIGGVVVEVEPGRLVEQGRITQDGTDDDRRSWDDDMMRRSIVIGDDLWTLGWSTLARHDLATLDHEALVSLR